MTDATSRVAMSGLVDLSRYPIDRLDGEEGHRLLERCRADLAQWGACQLEGFLRPESVAGLAEEALELTDLAYRHSDVHNVYFEDVDPGLPEHDPRRIMQRSSGATVAYDQIRAGAGIRALYESDMLLRFVGAALDKDPFYRNADRLGALNLVHYEEGDELGWHFDRAEFVVTLMLQTAAAGGEFEYVPNLRSETEENHPAVRRLLQGDTRDVLSFSSAPGTLAFFRGRHSIHRVTPIVGDRLRVNAVLSFADRPDHRLNELTQRLFYGRIA